MGLVILALKKPYTILVILLGILLIAVMTIAKMPIDIFPTLNIPLIYISQPYGGLTPKQMEGHITSFYETQFLYVSGIKKMESKNIQGTALIKLEFYPTTNMQAAMSEVVSAVNRAKAYMPEGTVPPTILRFDAGSVPVGDVVLRSKTRSIGELQDMAQFKIRPMFTALAGVSSPPPFGGNIRTIVITANPEKLRDYHLSPEDVSRAVNANNIITPAGNIRIGKLNLLTPIDTLVTDIHELEDVPIKVGTGPTVFLRDVATVEDSTDILAGYALVNGKRSVYIPVTKRADASTWTVVQEVKAAMQSFQDALPPDVNVSYEFDQSGYVVNALSELVSESAIGAFLTGLMVLLFLRCWRSTLIVVTTIPIALLSAVIALSATGQTINTMTLGGLALAVGVLVDEATVTIENIHTHLSEHKSVARGVYDALGEIVLPKLLAMLCILAVFVPAFMMTGVPRSLFIPLSLAVGFSMIASFFLSQTLVPILSIWLLDGKSHHAGSHDDGSETKTPGRFSFAHVIQGYSGILRRLITRPKTIILGYLALAAVILVFVGGSLGSELFPKSEGHEFRYRLKAPIGTRVEETERLTLKSLEAVKEEVGPDNVDMSLVYAGNQPSSYGISTIYLWTAGPEEAVINIALKKEGHFPAMDVLKDRLRKRFARELPNCEFSFEPADLVSQVMSLGAPTPVEILVTGKSLREDKRYADMLRQRLANLPYIRDLQYGQPLDYPSLNIHINREMAGQLGVTPLEIGQSVVAATSSTRFVKPGYWLDPKSGNSYLVQVELPQSAMASAWDLKNLPATQNGSDRPMIGDVADVSLGHTYGEIDRLNSQRFITLTANLHEKDLGGAATDINKIVHTLGKLPRGMTVMVRGQLSLMLETMDELKIGLLLAIVTIFLLISANFQSFKLAMIVVSTLPAVLCGVVLMLWITGTTLNIQSAMGAIMSMGVAVANAILLVTMAEHYRRLWKNQADNAKEGAIEGARSRLRPILMTSMAMIAGMIPMASGLGEGGSQTAPLGRAVIGGILSATIATLFILPLVFAWGQKKSSTESPSLNPEDPESSHYDLRMEPSHPSDHILPPGGNLSLKESY